MLSRLPIRRSVVIATLLIGATVPFVVPSFGPANAQSAQNNDVGIRRAASAYEPATRLAPPPMVMPSGMTVDESSFPTPRTGSSSFRIGSAQYSPNYSDGVGAFRVNCQLSHYAFDDPIVYPGQVRSTHLHAFYGNTAVSGLSTSESVINSGNSTCTGGTANRSAYWVPAMIDTNTSRVIAPGDENALQVYYKTGYRGVASSSVQNFPEGLRIIAGNARNTQQQPGAINDQPTTYHCHNVGQGSRTQQIPSCSPGDLLVMSVMFPQCWDGVNLDSANHQSHMAYGTWQVGCPASHPVPLPEITQNFRFPIPASGNTSWRLATDMYDGPAGYSGHADWMNGWDAPTFQRVIDNCYAGGLDCQMNLLGDGQALN
jgi:hypothetical protein